MNVFAKKVVSKILSSEKIITFLKSSDSNFLKYVKFLDWTVGNTDTDCSAAWQHTPE